MKKEDFLLTSFMILSLLINIPLQNSLIYAIDDYSEKTLIDDTVRNNNNRFLIKILYDSWNILSFKTAHRLDPKLFTQIRSPDIQKNPLAPIDRLLTRRNHLI